MSSKSPVQWVHFFLSSLCYFNENTWGAEESLIEDCDLYGLLQREWGKDCVSDVTHSKLVAFRSEWLEYKRTKVYADDAVFRHLDKDWLRIINKYLVPCLVSLETDLVACDVEFSPFDLHCDPLRFPSSKELLERAECLYGLLIDHGIITENYNLK